MALSDLELLALVEQAKEKQRGPQGETGVGIESIEQYDDTSFTIKLTNGASKKVSLPAAANGEPGQPGPAGPKGEPGAAGRDGRPGAAGSAGLPGVPGTDGVSIDTAVVLDNGRLLIGLTNGGVIDAGRVVGPAGVNGERGPTGLPGERGEDGAAVLSGPRAPQETDGQEGDHWIDISSAEFGFYKKGGNGWNKLANLRQPARDPRIGVAGGAHGGTDGGGGGGSGGGSEVHVGTEAPSFPSIGELWFDTNDAEGRMYVWTGNGWEPVLPQPDLDGYATQGYVDAKTAGLPYRIETDKVLREGNANVRSGEAEIQLVDNENNYSNVKFSGTNGVDVSSTASSIIIDGSKLSGDITAELSAYATIAYSDSEDQKLQNQIDDLEVQKGAASIYTCKGTSGGQLSPRPGEWACDNSASPLVTFLYIGMEDKAGAPTKTINLGDIIEIVGLGGDSRYKVINADAAPGYTQVEYISGNQGFVPDNDYTFYIYPQNEAGASKDYVDAQDDLKLDKAGGTVTGALITDGPVTINANSIYNGASPDENSLVTRKYVDDAVATGGDFLPTIGGTMTGSINFQGQAGIKAQSATSLSGRASLVIRGAGDKPIGIESGSSYLPALSIFGYDADEPDRRKQTINLRADGRIETTNSFSGQLIKSIRNTGYAFEAKPDDIATTALIRTNGSADFTNKLTLLKADTTSHSGFTIKGTIADGTEGNLLQSYHNSGTSVDAVNYSGKMEEPSNIVNKGYVDAQLGPKPAQLAWLWEGDKGSTTTAPSSGKFLRSSSSSTDYLRLSFETDNGVDLGDAKFSDTNVSFADGPIGCIWYYHKENGKWRLRMQFRCSSWRWNYNAGGGAHFEFGFSSRHGRAWSDLTVGATYYITVGGFF